LDDIGAVERQFGWYVRSGFDLAHKLGWQPRRVVCWLLALASEEVEAVIRANRDLIAQAFTARARGMARLLNDGEASVAPRGLALIDPASHRRAWILGSRIDGRRSIAPYRDYRDAARLLAA
jgi:hypothetical protein